MKLNQYGWYWEGIESRRAFFHGELVIFRFNKTPTVYFWRPTPAGTRRPSRWASWATPKVKKYKKRPTKEQLQRDWKQWYETT